VKAMSKFFTTERYSIVSAPIVTIISVINAALGGAGAVAVTASKRGLSIKLDGKTLVTGKTPTELHEAFKARQAKAMTAKENPKTGGCANE
jgi:hypothetical protein